MSPPSPPSRHDEPWTADYASSNGASAPVRNDSTFRIIVVGYIAAIGMPPIGLIVGIVLVARRTPGTGRHGWWIIALSIVAAVVWVLLLSSGVVTTASNDSTF
jgi:hypothetical protein